MLRPGWNNIFCMCLFHFLVLCDIWLSRGKAEWRKKSYRSSHKRSNARSILVFVSHLFDRDYFIIYTANHIQYHLSDNLYFHLFVKFTHHIIACSTLYSTHYCILPWWFCQCWYFGHETEKHHMEIYLDFFKHFPQLFISIFRSATYVSIANKRSKLWQVKEFFC